MSGESDLRTLLATMSPSLMRGEYVFCTFESARYGDHAGLEPVAAVTEREGLTLVIPKSRADACGLEHASVFRGITLNVHSSLDAVGLTAVVSTTLADHGISANVIAGFFHDHIFVPSAAAESAMSVLSRLAR